ncbi:hypothetical protein [Aureimonas sp. AU22]|uniref:hypothetical protein n=1 Tax=Aureimonas sp. AU22 TaxID=1638162 RepID=UPI0007865441|nr:hypothetical protein [Aureimonas sp. AU22]
MKDPFDVGAWLRSKPDLQSMRERFPEEWARVERDMATAISERSAARMNTVLLRSGPAWTVRAKGRKRRREETLRLVRQRMAILALQRIGTDAVTRGDEDAPALGRMSAAIASGLLRDGDGNKKPVSMRVFRLAWPFVRDKGAFLTREQSRGSYCFLSREFVDAVAGIVGGRRCLEIAAGDGTLTRFLAGAGIQIAAVDDMSWGHEIRYPDFVRKMDAREALAALAPEVVICSWPPPGNPFEAAVFDTRSVQTYVVVGSRYGFATGNRDAYRSSPGFTCESDASLSGLVLPPEAGHEVLVFRRRVE